LAQESSTKIGAKQIQMVGGSRALAQSRSCREHVPQAIGLSLTANGMSVGANHRNLGHMDTRTGREAGPAGQLPPIFPVNIAIADKNPMVLRALEALLAMDRRFNLLLMASDGAHFLSSLAHLPVSLGVIGWELPPIRATEILQALAKRPARPKIVVYSSTKDTTAPAETLRLGGAGFVSKLSPPERLLEVFAAVAAGDMVFPFVDIHKVRPDPLTSLTHRERDLLAALESGQSNAQLARDFGVSINTVKFHLRNLFGKLDVRNRTQAICLYLETRR
jgi:two-component system, NarL family, nitrate/nitrite response regulator NarP